MDVNGLNVVISTTGAPEAVRAFGSVDAAAQKVRDQIAKALAQTNNDLGRIGDVLAGAGAKASSGLEQVAVASEGLSVRGARATQSVSRGLEIIARTGQATGRSMDNILASVSSLALGFGPTGLLVGAIAIGTTAIVDLFAKARKELEKTQNEFRDRLIEMAKSADVAGLAGKFGSATELQSGDAVARQLLRSASDGDVEAMKRLGVNTDDKEIAFLARTQGIDGLMRRRGELQTKVSNNPSFYRQGSTDADALRAINSVLRQMQDAHDLALKAANIAVTAAVDEGKVKKGPRDTSAKATDWLMGVLSKSMPGFSDDSVALTSQMRAEFAAKETADLVNLLKKYNPGVDRSGERKEERDFAYGIKAKASTITLTPTEADAQETVKAWTQLADRIGKEMASTMARSLSSGFEALFARGGSLKSGFKAMTGAILEGLGSMFEQVGEQALAGMMFMSSIKHALETFMPELGIPGAIGLIALGAALKGAGSRVASSGSSGGTSYSSSVPSAIHSTYYVNPSAPSSHSYSAAGLHAAQPLVVNATFLSPHDPTWQRQLNESLAFAARRTG